MVSPIVTRAYDNARTGVNDAEAKLSATAVRARGIVRLFSIPIPDDSRLEAGLLAVSDVRLANGKLHNVIYQASMGNTVYAFDAETGAELWKRKLGRPIDGNKNIDNWLINVRWGILSTPVIDQAAGLLYACALISQDGSPAKGQHFLAALRLADGVLARPLLNLEGAIYAPPGLPQQRFDSAQRKQRAALTLTQGHVLIPFGTIAETSSRARGWLIAVNTTTWSIAATWCSTVSGFGGGLWQGGSGPAIDDTSRIFVITGNGSFDPSKGDYGESVVALELQTSAPVSLNVLGWWTPWTDTARTSGSPELAEGDDTPRASNFRKTTVIGHAMRLGRNVPRISQIDIGGVSTGPDDADQTTAEQVDNNIALIRGGAWDDQDFGSGGPVYVASSQSVLACGKDGILYTVSAGSPGNTQPRDLTPSAAPSNYARLQMPPILYTYFDPSMQPAPASPTELNKLPGGATRHLHGSPIVWRSAAHGMMHFVGGENSSLRAWSIDQNGRSRYLAGSAEIASALSPRPPGGMPGWNITMASNAGKDGIIVAMIPYKDSNMALSAGRMVVYDAQNFVQAGGENVLQVIWDSEDWGPEHAFTHPKFNRPIVWNGRIYRPTYDGRIDVYGLTE